MTLRSSTTSTAGVEDNPIADDVGPIADGMALAETEDRPALICGSSSDRIGTSHGRARYVTLSKDLHAWTGLPIAPYAGLSVATCDDELVGIGGLSILGFDSFTKSPLWDGHNLHHLMEVPFRVRQSTGVVVVDVNVGVTYAIGSWAASPARARDCAGGVSAPPAPVRHEGPEHAA